MDDYSDTKYIRARKSVIEIKRFYGKALRGIIAILIVGALNYYLNEWRNPWFLWVVFGVGLSLLLRAYKVYGLNLIFGKDWENRKIKEFMEKSKP